jgi:hypothetical protein
MQVTDQRIALVSWYYYMLEDILCPILIKRLQTSNNHFYDAIAPLMIFACSGGANTLCQDF